MTHLDLISPESASRHQGSIKGVIPYLSKPGLISLGGGLPTSEYFPFDAYSFRAPSVGHFSEAETRESGITVTAGKFDLSEEKSLFDIATAFNYGQGHGAAQLLRFLVEHTEIVHDPKYADWQCLATIGSTSALDMLLRMLGKPGTFMLSEEYTFATAVEAASPMGIETLGVAVDDEGLLPSDLDHILSTWDSSTRRNNAPKPHLLYTVPTGQNPTGATQSLARRKEIYRVAQKHDLIILEDEPYYFLQMQPYTGASTPPPPPPKTHTEFLSSLVPSLLSLDTDGRVIRLDSFSKVIAPGCRVGWITAPQQIVERYQRHSDVSTQGPSGFSQLALFKLLDEHWGHGGYLDWLVHIRMEYTRRRDVLLGACEKHLPREVVSWRPPMAGMFFWMKVDWRRHPLAKEMGVRELEDRIFLHSVHHGALIIKGSFFRADGGKGEAGAGEDLFFRATYAAASEENIVEAVRRFGVALREQFGLADDGQEDQGQVVNGVNGT